MSIETPGSKGEPKGRVRRSPEAARENILAAAEAILVEQGPQAVKLADVAARAGVVHATILHHFGSIAGVEAALMERMIRQLVDRIVAVFETEDAEPGFGARALFEAFETRGAARLAAWLELTGEAERLTLVRTVVQEVIATRIARSTGASPETIEDFVLVNVILAIGVGLFGPTLDKLMGKPVGRSRAVALEMIQGRLSAVSGRE